MAVTDLAPAGPVAQPQAPAITAGEVTDRWRRSTRVLDRRRREFWLNAAFYDDDQWLYWDTHNSRLDNWADLPNHRERPHVVVNQIQPRIDNLLGRSLQHDLVFEVPPADPDDATVLGSKRAEWVLEAARSTQQWESVRLDNLWNTLMGAVGGVMMEWDPYAHDDGQGDVSLTALSVAEVGLEPGTRNWWDSRWSVAATTLTPGQAQDVYRLPEAPKADAAWQPMSYRPRGTRPGDADLVTVYTCYERPTAESEGFRVVVIGDRVVDSGPWPFPFDELNLTVFRCQPFPGRWYGKTFVDSARDPQVRYNHYASVLAEHGVHVSNTRLAVGVGSLFTDKTRLSDAPGEILEYDPAAPTPQWVAPPHLPRWFGEEFSRAIAEMDEILYTHAVARGEDIGDRAATSMVGLLSERSDTPLAMMARDQAAGWGRIGSQALECYEAYVRQPRQGQVNTQGGPPLRFGWTGDDLRGQTQAVVPQESTRPTSHTAIVAELVNIQQNFPQVLADIPRERLAKMLDQPGRNLFEQVADPDCALAQRENQQMLSGYEAIPEAWEDHPKHITEHNVFRNSDIYRSAPDEVREVVDLHIEAHQRFVEEELDRQMRMNQQIPGMAGMPQAAAPMGSELPPPAQMNDEAPPEDARPRGARP